MRKIIRKIIREYGKIIGKHECFKIGEIYLIVENKHLTICKSVEHKTNNMLLKMFEGFEDNIKYLNYDEMWYFSDIFFHLIKRQSRGDDTLRIYKIKEGEICGIVGEEAFGEYVVRRIL